MTEINISLIGAGQIGSRHLQALSNLNGSASIYVVDPSQNALGVAKSRFDEVNKNNSITTHYLTSIDEIDSGELDISIIATSSKFRSKVILELTKKCHVKNMLLEKVLFQSIGEYSQIQAVLDEQAIPTWVNCARRQWDVYHKIKEFLVNNEDGFDLTISGSNIDLASNGIHFVDLFSFLAESENFEIDVSNLSDEILDSKRQSYIEFHGTLLLKDGKNRCTITSYKNGSKPVTFYLSSKDIEIELNEQNGNFTYSKFPEWQVNQEIVKIPYQSELTNLVVTDILNTNQSKLTSYQSSSKIHVLFLNAIMGFLSEINYPVTDKCPIT